MHTLSSVTADKNQRKPSMKKAHNVVEKKKSMNTALERPIQEDSFKTDDSDHYLDPSRNPTIEFTDKSVPIGVSSFSKAKIKD